MEVYKFNLPKLFSFLLELQGAQKISNGDIQCLPPQLAMTLFLNSIKTEPSYDTSSSPHKSNTTKVQFPAELLGCFPHQHKSLSIRHNLGCIKSLLKQIVMTAFLMEQAKLRFLQAILVGLSSDYWAILACQQPNNCTSTKSDPR